MSTVAYGSGAVAPGPDTQGLVDLRSDTVTRPTPAMAAAMAAAALGDDVFGDDPTVNRLQARLAEVLGFEDALFMPSGTASNLCALLTHGTRGDEYLVGQLAHCYRYEGGGGAVLGGLQPQPLAMRACSACTVGSSSNTSSPTSAAAMAARIAAVGRVTVSLRRSTVMSAPRTAGTPFDPPRGCGPAWDGPALGPLP